jgi:hypothetical protein
MFRRRWIPLVSLIALALLLWFSSAEDARSQAGLQQVFVTNFPETQTIDGSVEIEGTVRLSEMVSVLDITVPPVQQSDSTRWIDGGLVTLNGFSHVVLSLHGVVKGSVQRPGTVGAVLIPEERTIREAFDEQGLVHFALEVSAPGLNAQTPYFASAQPRHLIAFKQYRIWLYNTTDKTVSANLFAYLTN